MEAGSSSTCHVIIIIMSVVIIVTMSLTWCTELAALVLEYCVMAELAEQVDLRTLASARDFSMAHFVI